MGALLQVAKSTPELRDRYEAMVDSKYVHRIEFAAHRENSHLDMKNPENVNNGKGSSTTTVINSRQPPLADGAINTIATLIAHETLGHGYDADQGILDATVDPISKIERREIEASRIENEYRKTVDGLDERGEYGGLKLPIGWLGY